MDTYDTITHELLDKLTNEELAKLGDKCSSMICERNSQEQNKLWYNIVSAVEQYVNKYGCIGILTEEQDYIFDETYMNKVGEIKINQCGKSVYGHTKCKL